MKKIITSKTKYIKTLIFILFFSVNNISFAQWENSPWTCNIESWPAPVLQDYISNLRKVTQNITSQTKKNSKWWTFFDNIVSSQFDRFKSEWARFYNSITSWDWYFGSFDFYVAYPMFNHVPYPVMRDYKLIEKNIDFLDNYYQILIRNWVSDVIVKDACSWMQNCNLNWTSLEITAKLMKNTNDILQLYSERITSDTNTTSKTKFILVPNNFQDEFSNYYNSSTSENCSKSEWDKWIMQTLEDWLNKITENWIFSENAIKDWKSAYRLALKIQSWESLYEEEQKLLTQELDRQWISGDNANIILWNLEESNNKPLSFTNNPVVNSVKNTFSNNFNSFVPSFVWFAETVSQTMNWSKKMSWDSNSPNTNIIIPKVGEVNKEIKISQDIKQKVDDLYNLESPFAQQQNTNDKNLLSRLVKMHTNLAQAINVLDKATPTSVKVCDMQAKWQWKCDYRK